MPRTTQIERDIAPIRSAFPAVELDDGAPSMKAVIEDAEIDPVSVFFPGDGTVCFDTSIYSHLVFHSEALIQIATLAKLSEALFDAWIETPSGKAWAEENEL